MCLFQSPENKNCLLPSDIIHIKLTNHGIQYTISTKYICYINFLPITRKQYIKCMLAWRKASLRSKMSLIYTYLYIRIFSFEIICKNQITQNKEFLSVVQKMLTVNSSLSGGWKNATVPSFSTSTRMLSKTMPLSFYLKNWCSTVI